MAYTVLARRYRSQTFDDVLGQDVAVQTLRNAIQAGRVAHAYLFCGTRGVGKTTMARILAKSLNCLNADGPTIHPCLKCDSCLSVNVGEDLDVIEIDGASNNGVDNIRQLRENASYRPARARFKIYIIDEVHMLSAGAFNALLKILEEPPDHVKFIFATTEPNKVLATIQSRCQRFDFHNISHEVIARQIGNILKEEGVTFEPDLLVHLARLANGSMRDGLSVLDQLISAGSQPLNIRQLIDLIGVPDRQKVTQLLTAIAGHAAAVTLQGLDELLMTGQSAAQICESLIEMMREVMVYQCAGKDSPLLVLTDQERTDMAALTSKFDVAGLVYNITALQKLHWTLKNSETSRALLEASLLRLALSEQFIGLDRLVAQLRACPAGTVDVKKKSLISTESSNAPASAAPVAEPSSAVNKAVDADDLCRRWPQIAARIGTAVGGGVASMLPQAQAAGFKNQTLQLAFPDNGAGKMAQQICQGRAAAIEKELADIVGHRVSVSFAAVANAAPAAESPKAEIPAGAKASRLERNEVLNDPVVQRVLQGLGATPIDIQRVEHEPSDTEPEESVE